MIIVYVKDGHWDALHHFHRMQVDADEITFSVLWRPLQTWALYKKCRNSILLCQALLLGKVGFADRPGVAVCMGQGLQLDGFRSPLAVCLMCMQLEIHLSH